MKYFCMQSVAECAVIFYVLIMYEVMTHLMTQLY